ncbi:hypothetical protein HMPREF1624_05742 [Sporothrix schenckii ATCC 58251]|uniref:Uncharacterized protein n=1 Tax=Sporothrix schenckii (strain ATCC 58251 / de Perez 2211183) TaxID=1391915 RepID=U7PRL3_SPOS1|nr:hypothetical protein HMPREF1624_05742 [Sporothrix schenckii ATCC 58251]
MDRPPEARSKGSSGPGDTMGSRAVSSPISYSRDASTINQTPSTPLLLSPDSAGHLAPPSDPLLDIPPDAPPPSYEEATGISPASLSRPVPPVPGASPSPGSAPSPGAGLPPSMAHNSNNLAVPSGHPLRPAASNGHLGANGGRRTSAGSSTNANARLSSGSLGAGSSRPAVAGGFGSVSSSHLPGYQQADGGTFGGKPGQPRPATSAGGGGGGGSSSSSSNGASGPGRRPAPGSVPTGRQFPAAFNLYGDNYSRVYFLGEHQQTPLYAVRMRPLWQMSNPVIALHNGPNPETSPLLAAVDYVPMSDHMSITLPPPLTYRGGSTAVRLDIVLGWSHFYTFTMEVGTDPRNVHRETFEWRHSYGNAVAALGGAREGWKLVRMSTAPLPGAPRAQPAPGFVSSDGREVVAMYSDARMSMTKQLKFAYVGTGLTGALGERWSVMAATSALAIWEKEEAVRNRH